MLQPEGPSLDPAISATVNKLGQTSVTVSVNDLSGGQGFHVDFDAAKQYYDTLYQVHENLQADIATYEAESRASAAKTGITGTITGMRQSWVGVLNAAGIDEPDSINDTLQGLRFLDYEVATHLERIGASMHDYIQADTDIQNQIATIGQ